MSIETKIAAAYRQILGRDPDGDGLRHHVKLIEGHTLTFRTLVRGLLLSAEWEATFIKGRTAPSILNAAYRCALGRLPTAAELTEGRRGASRAGWRRLLESIVDSSEYTERFGDDTIPLDSRGTEQDETSRIISTAPQGFRSMDCRIKPIAFYLPQFHRIAQNDEWWGKGFTEWNNVRKGAPHFQGHYQPHIPSELGYYDLEQPGTLAKQAELAARFGIHGFCFYYYWFDGEVLLDLPLRTMLQRGVPEFPFCLCWANENWTRRWDGKEDEVLIAQRHSPEDDLAFIRQIEPILTGPNYIRVQGKPMLLVYRASLLPDARQTLERWRDDFRARNFGELHLVMVRSFSETQPPAVYGFDAAVQFPPHFTARSVSANVRNKAVHFAGEIYDYDSLSGQATAEFRESAAHGGNLYPGVMPSWDNTARRGRHASVWINSSPEKYRLWLAEVIRLQRLMVEEQHRWIFINAWNEWAEGCHLEPDERFGFAWLNATASALAIHRESPHDPKPAARPQAPPLPTICLDPLPNPPNIVVSVLLFHREDIVEGLLRQLLPQIALARQKLSCELFLSFNYMPECSFVSTIKDIVAELMGSADSAVHIVKNGLNLGFGAGHNAIFERAASDLFVMVNSDLRIDDNTWILQVVNRMVNSDVAILGLAENGWRFRNDASATQVGVTDQGFDYVDASALAIRSDLARRFGLFSPAFPFFYFEDADLSLRYRQMGLQLDILRLRSTHERGGSARLVPRFTLEKVLGHNRARFAARWGNYLQSRSLPNRLALTFRTFDRRLQCASLPAVLALLSEHPTAVLDVWGVHAQLTALFAHSRIRLIPAWQQLVDTDYLRSYELHQSNAGTLPLALQIADHLQTDAAFEHAQSHLEQLARNSRDARTLHKAAIVYIARAEPLFDGKHPEPLALVAIGEDLQSKNFSVRYYSEYAAFELQPGNTANEGAWRYAAWTSSLDVLNDIAGADLVVTSATWAAELAQLLNRRTVVWTGALFESAAVWSARAVAFSDRSLPCLGCSHRFGQDHRNLCLRGDIACMSSGLVESLTKTVALLPESGSRQVVDRVPRVCKVDEVEAAEVYAGLHVCPPTSASSVLVLTPINPSLPDEVIARARALAETAVEGMRAARVIHDSSGTAPPRGVPHPLRQAAMAKLRQEMIIRHLHDERWVFWVDADIIDYRADLVEQLIDRAGGGVVAPLVLMEGDSAEQVSNRFGFGPGRFYDVAGFVENGRWARFTEPYFDQLGPVYNLDSVGSCYLVNADLYRNGAQHELDPRSKQFVEESAIWHEDSISRNQASPANCFSEHYSVCAFARRSGLPVQAFADLIALHQRP